MQVEMLSQNDRMLRQMGKEDILVTFMEDKQRQAIVPVSQVQRWNNVSKHIAKKAKSLAASVRQAEEALNNGAVFA